MYGTCLVQNAMSFFCCLGEPEALLNPKKKIWETLQADLRVDSIGKATFRGKALVVEGKGEITAPSLKDVMIK